VDVSEINQIQETMVRNNRRQKPTTVQLLEKTAGGKQSYGVRDELECSVGVAEKDIYKWFWF